MHAVQVHRMLYFTTKEKESKAKKKKKKNIHHSKPERPIGARLAASNWLNPGSSTFSIGLSLVPASGSVLE